MRALAWCMLGLAYGAAWADEPVTRFAFGSCIKQDRPQPIWEAVVAARPQVFAFLGDNIYGDSENMSVLRAKYDKLAAQPMYQQLRQSCRVLGTWDDHDYGVNDGGAEYPMRAESQQLFLDFLQVPDNSPRRQRAGVYDAVTLGPEGQRVQFILLDTRYHRSPLRMASGTWSPGMKFKAPFVPNEAADATVLGEEQWVWLAEQLKVPAEFRVIASSIQVLADEHVFEKWGNFPRERERLWKLMRETRAEGVVFLSGDRHKAEISRFTFPGGYAVADVTSSSMNAAGGKPEANSKRIGTQHSEVNFGQITFDWAAVPPRMALAIRRLDGSPLEQVVIGREELVFPPAVGP